MVPPRFIKILNVGTERAMEGTNIRVVTVTMNVTKKVEGIEIHDPDRQDNVFRNLLEPECFHTHSVEDLAGNKIIGRY